ncbi:MAG: hypothetical protein AB7N91_27945 [Candidatus Tectimicrobiota bacterium]
MAMLTVFSLTLLGCSDDDDFDNANRRDLENRSFSFTDGRALDLPGQQVTLTFGAFGIGGQPRAGTATLTTASVPGGMASGSFFVETEGNVFNEGINLSPDSTCFMEITSSTLQAVPVGKQLRFDPCDVDDVTGALRLENDDTEAVSVSTVP